MANYNLTQTGDEVQAYIDSIPVIDVTGTLSGSNIVFATNPYTQIAANYAADCSSIVRLTVGTAVYLLRVNQYDGTNYTASEMSGAHNVVATIGSSSASATIDAGIDATPTQGSNNLVKSGGVWDELNEIDEILNGSSIGIEQEPSYLPCRYVGIAGNMLAKADGDVYAYCNPIDISGATAIRVRGVLNSSSFGGIFFSKNATIPTSSAQANAWVIARYYGTTSSSGNVNDEMYFDATALAALKAQGATHIYVGVYQAGQKEMVFYTMTEGVVEKVEEIEGKNLRGKVQILTTDTEIEIFNKLLAARDAGNCDVYWEQGTYNFTDVVYNHIATLNEFSSRGVYELPLGGNCNYYFNNSTINFSRTSYNGASNGFGCVRQNKGNFRLYDGKITASNVVYCVHDEAQGSVGSYIHEYHNMILSYEGQGDSLSKPIGGGTGQYGEIVIDNCVLLNANNSCDYDASWHGRSNDGNTAHHKVFIKNCYLSKGVDMGNLDTLETATLVYCGNSAATAPTLKTRWTSYIYCNEVRA